MILFLIFPVYFRFTPKDDVKGYSIWGVVLAEVEVDILTGEKQVIFFKYKMVEFLITSTIR